MYIGWGFIMMSGLFQVNEQNSVFVFVLCGVVEPVNTVIVMFNVCYYPVKWCVIIAFALEYILP